MIKRMDHRNCFSFTEVCDVFFFFLIPLISNACVGHTARPTDFCWAPEEMENWTAASASEDNVVMVWQPTMRVWAGEQVKIDVKELEDDAMEGVEATNEPGASGSKSNSSVSASGADD